MATMTTEEIEREKGQAQLEVQQAMMDLKKEAPDIAEGLSTAVGSALGAGGSLAALTFLGTTGLSAAGITSGLAAAGSIVGGGMVAGIGVLAAPIAILGIAGYALAKKRKNAKKIAAISTAISKLYSVQKRLMENAEFFKNELATLEVSVKFLEEQLSKIK